MNKKLILGIDVGITSVGWAIIDNDANVVDFDVRLFDESNKKSNEDRRTFRGSRRLKRRRSFRLERLRNLLIKEGIINKNFKHLDNPYELRKKGLHQKLNNAELATALLHIAKRRGSSLETVDDVNSKTSDNKLTPKAALNENEKQLNKFEYVCLVQIHNLEKYGKIRNDLNVFKTSDYIKEVKQILSNQDLNQTLNNEIINIIESRRHFSEGPGSINSPTKYGRWRKLIDHEYNEVKDHIINNYPNIFKKQNLVFTFNDTKYKVFKNGTIINKEPYNLINLMRGKCSLYEDQLRAPKNALSALEFNLVDELVNMRIITEENRRFTKREISLVLDYLRKNHVFKPKGFKGFLKLVDLKEEDLIGYRIDKSNKPIITEFTSIQNISKVLEKDEFKTINNEKTLNEIAEILTENKVVEERNEELLKIIDNESITEKLSTLGGFSEYHSLSFKAINELKVEMVEQQKNQQEIITDNQLRENKPLKHLTFDESAILSPVAKRAHRQALLVIESLIKEYGNFDSIVIETTREKNSLDAQKKYKEVQKRNELRREQAEEILKKYTPTDKISSQLILKTRLYLEQDGKCIYTGKTIDIERLINDHGSYQIDHIIPKSISFDDSYNNKVLVLPSANQSKDNLTPLKWFSSGRTNESIYSSYNEFRSYVMNNSKLPKAKKMNLTFEEDINKYDVQQTFINRNLVDTSYAARALQTTLRAYFNSNKINTKIYSVKGHQTNEIRNLANARYVRNNKGKAYIDAPLYKDRNKYYHHAVDAIIIAGLSMQENFNAKPYLQQHHDLNKDIIKREYQAKYDPKVNHLIKQLNNLDLSRIKYSWKVDKKPNRSVSDQTIYSTRVYEGEEYVIKKYQNISEMTASDIQKKIIDNKEKLLVYKHDQRTYQHIEKAYQQYKHEKYPFKVYEENHGPLRKYAKNNKGPIIKNLKYQENKLGNHISISNNYNSKNKNVVLLQISPYRTDFYISPEGEYKFLTIRYSDIKHENNKYVISQDKYNELKEMKEILDKDKFIFSLYKNSILRIKTNDYDEIVRFRVTNNDLKKIIEVKPINQYLKKQDMRTIGKKILKLEKYNVSITGKIQKVVSEDLKLEF